MLTRFCLILSKYNVKLNFNHTCIRIQVYVLRRIKPGLYYIQTRHFKSFEDQYLSIDQLPSRIKL